MRPGGHVRPPADALRPGARRRGPGPPEDQVGDPGLRQDRRPPRVPLLRQRRDRARRDPRRPDAPTTTPSSTRWARAPTGAWASRASTCPAATRPPSSWAGTTPTPTTATWASTSAGARRWWSATATWPWTWRASWPARAERAGQHRHRRPRPGRARPPAASARSYVLGRRGPAQAAFTTKELQELGELPGVDVVGRPGRGGARPAEPRPRLARRAERTRDAQPGDPARATPPARRPRRAAAHRAALPGLAGGASSASERVEGLEIERNELYRAEDGTLRPRATEARETLRLRPGLPGHRLPGGGRSPGVPFDAWAGRIPNEGGRVLDPDRGEPMPGEYAVGWIKRGPQGIIGTNKPDSQETVQRPPGRPGRRAPGQARRARRGRCSRACCASASATTSPTRTGSSSTSWSASAGEPTGRRGSSSAGSRRCCTPWASARSASPRGGRPSLRPRRPPVEPVERGAPAGTRPAARMAASSSSGVASWPWAAPEAREMFSSISVPPEVVAAGVPAGARRRPGRA